LGEYQLELIFRIGSKVERVSFPFIYSAINIQSLFLEVLSCGEVKVYRPNVELAEQLDLDEKFYNPLKNPDSAWGERGLS